MYYVARIKTYKSETLLPTIWVEAITNELAKAKTLAKALNDIHNEENVSYQVLTVA